MIDAAGTLGHLRGASGQPNAPAFLLAPAVGGVTLAMGVQHAHAFESNRGRTADEADMKWIDNHLVVSGERILRIVHLGIALSFAGLGTVHADEAATIVALSEEIFIGDDETAIVVEEDETAIAEWTTRPAVIRQSDDGAIYLRTTDAAFENPDARMALELKYHFPLVEAPMWNCDPLNRHSGGPVNNGDEQGDDDSTDANDSVVEGEDSERAERSEDDELTPGLLARLIDGEKQFPLRLDTPGIEVQWLDYRARLRPKHAVLLIGNQPVSEELLAVDVPDVVEDVDAAGAGRSDEATDASLRVLRLNRTLGGGWRVMRQVASVSLKEEDMIAAAMGRCLLDTWDRPPDVGGRISFWGRVIAVLIQPDDRYAVDFYGESLNEESHCRVWLTGEEHPWGIPQAIRFIEIPIAEDTEATPREISVLAIRYVDAAGDEHAIAIDFPLCRTPMLDQLQRLAKSMGRRRGRGGRGGFSAQRLLGDELLDELSRRLVDGHY